jgi:hypothetical protein
MVEAEEVPSALNTQPHAPPVARTRAHDLNMETMQLLTRLVIGAVSEGSGYLLDHIRNQESKLEQLTVEGKCAHLDEATRSELVLYLAVGTAVRTQRQTIRLTKSGFGLSMRTLSRTVSVLAAATDNPLARPLRKPVQRAAERLGREINRSVIVGHREVLEGSTLTRATALEIIDELIAYISESPALAQLVSDQIGHQSIGMATALTETSRAITGKADRTIEETLRSWIGLPSRSQLPPSPFAGKPESIVHPGLTTEAAQAPVVNAKE